MKIRHKTADFCDAFESKFPTNVIKKIPYTGDTESLDWCISSSQLSTHVTLDHQTYSALDQNTHITGTAQ